MNRSVDILIPSIRDTMSNLLSACQDQSPFQIERPSHQYNTVPRGSINTYYCRFIIAYLHNTLTAQNSSRLPLMLRINDKATMTYQ